MWVNLSMPRPDLSRLTSEEKDALILALLDRVAALEAKLGEPPKTPANSSLPPSRGRKTNRPPRAKRPRRRRMGPGVTRVRAAAPDRTVGCYAERCRHCGVSLDGAGQTLRQAYDHIDLPPVRPVVTRVAIFGRRCPCCRRRVRGVAPADMPPGSPFGASVQVMLAYLHHHHAIAYDRLSRLMGELFGLQISEGAIANALHRAAKPLAQAGEVIAARLREAQVVGCDETGARLSTDALGTRMAWEWVLVSDRAVLHRIRPSRGRDVIDELMAGHRPRCWVADRWAAQQDRAQTHQICLAHTIRTQSTILSRDILASGHWIVQRDDMTDLQTVLMNDDAFDDQLQDSLPIGKAGLVQTAVQARAERGEIGCHRLRLDPVLA